MYLLDFPDNLHRCSPSSQGSISRLAGIRIKKVASTQNHLTFIHLLDFYAGSFLSVIQNRFSISNISGLSVLTLHTSHSQFSINVEIWSSPDNLLGTLALIKISFHTETDRVAKITKNYFPSCLFPNISMTGWDNFIFILFLSSQTE